MDLGVLTVEQMPALMTLIRASPWPGTGFAWLLFSLNPSFSEKVRASMIPHGYGVMLMAARMVQDGAKHSCAGHPTAACRCVPTFLER